MLIRLLEQLLEYRPIFFWHKSQDILWIGIRGVKRVKTENGTTFEKTSPA